MTSFSYTLKMYIKGYTKGIEMNDIYKVSPDAHSEKLGEKLEHYWEKEKNSRDSPSICRVVLFCFGKTFFLVGIIQLVSEIVKT